MKSLNRRLWSVPRRRGITDLVEFVTPKGIPFGITQLEIALSGKGTRELSAQKLLSGVRQFLPEVLARNQEPSQ